MIDIRMDYCNALIHTTSVANIYKLQRVQNSMAHAVTNSRHDENNIKHVLVSLHWLPVEYRIQYKLAVTTFKVLTTQEPSYLSELIRFHIPSRHLQSSGCNRLQQDGIKLAFTERALYHAAPAVWNSLPQSITSNMSCFNSFERLLKSEYFNRSHRQ